MFFKKSISTLYTLSIKCETFPFKVGKKCQPQVSFIADKLGMRNIQLLRGQMSDKASTVSSKHIDIAIGCKFHISQIILCGERMLGTAVPKPDICSGI